VRVVSIGTAGPAFDGAADCSVEFCGGTHLSATGEAGLFKIVEESSVSKGIRRIVAVTGAAALRHVGRTEQQLRAIAQQLGTTPDEAPKRIAALQDEIKQLKKKLASGGGAGLLEPAKAAEKIVGEASAVGETRVVVARFDGAQPDYLLGVMDAVKARCPSYVLLLAAVDDDKIAYLTAASDDAIKKGLKAGDLARDVAKATGGGGGGRPNMAQAGGKDVAALDAALAFAKGAIEQKLA
jgi:alanyl-tRNA synthetase